MGEFQVQPKQKKGQGTKMFQSTNNRSWLNSIKSALGMKPERRRGFQAAHRSESLEPREVMTINAGAGFLVNSTTQGSQNFAANASSANGMSVAVWSHLSSGGNYDVYAQVYNSDGSRRGGEIRVATSRREELGASVAMDARGNFVVVWQERISATDADIKAQRFSSNGVRQGSVIDIANSGSEEIDPDVAMAADGRFTVAFEKKVLGHFNIVAKQYSATGAYQRSIFVASSPNNEVNPSIAAAADGRLAIAYQEDFGNDSDVMLKRYNADGSLSGTHTITNSPLDEEDPDVAMDDRGNSVVVWSEFDSGDWDVMFRTVNSTGSRGAIGTVRATTDGEASPSVAMDRSDGDFVVAFNTGSFSGGSRRDDLHVAEFASNGRLRRDQTIPGYASPFTSASISVDGNDNYFVSYPNRGVGGLDIHGQYGVL